MRRKVLIIPDKFKGTLTGPEAAQAIARGWAAVYPEDELELMPMSDGGDGFGEALAFLFRAERFIVPTVDAAHRPREGAYWWDPHTRTIIIETAQIIGLALLPPGQFHPFELDTFGLGKVFQDAASKSPKAWIIGIGGSATNDGGFGMARALGWEFRDQDNKSIDRWTCLEALATIAEPPQFLTPSAASITIAVDVQNKLLGAEGASRIYGPQKGLTPADFATAEACLGKLSDIYFKQFGRNIAEERGTGAAGGLGFGLKAFCGGVFESGFHIFARLAKLEEQIQAADLVITGEGSLDAQTMMGKGVGALALECKKKNVAVLALAGQSSATGDLFTSVRSLVPTFGSFDQIRLRSGELLEELATRAARDWRD
jgi:glycerate kinase